MSELRPVLASPLNLKDLFDRWRWQEAIFLTYTFDLPFFESFVLSSVVRGGGRSVAIAACATWLPDRLRAWADADEIREAGRTYTLSQVVTGGVFHPKVIIAASSDRGLVAIGSGNLSPYGMATGGELFTLIEWSGADVPPLAREAWQLCRGIATTLRVDRTFGARVEALAAVAPGIAVPAPTHQLLHNLEEPILDQFLDAAHPVGPSVERVVAWSPFTDRRLLALDTLVRRTAPALVTMAVQPGITSLDGARLESLRSAHPDVAWEFRELVPREASGYAGAMIHAKGILLVRADGSQVALVGSPNLSAPALLRRANDGNLETALIHEGRDLESAFFGADSPFVLAGLADPATLAWSPDPTTIAAPSVTGPRLVGARLEAGYLILEVDGTIEAETRVLLDRTLAIPLASPAERRISVPEGAAPGLVELVWDGGQSGPVVVADVGQLAQVRAGVEGRRAVGLDAIDYGADADILAVLDEMARIGIFTLQDAVRALAGRSGPTPDEEATEAAAQVPAVSLDEIDFERLRQHPRARSYDATVDDLGYGTPRIVLWLDEVARQFASLWASTNAPPDPEDEGELDPDDPPREPDAPPKVWPVSRRVRVLVRNRLRRITTGLNDPQLWKAVDHSWSVMNHAYLVSILARFWDRAVTETPVITAEDAATLVADSLTGFWGDDRQPGFVGVLETDELTSMALLLTDKACDSLLASVAIRVLEAPSAGSAVAPFAVGGYVRTARQLGILDQAVVERALVWLGRSDQDPTPYLERLVAASSAFSWERFSANLAWRYGLESAAVLRELAVGGVFAGGAILAIRPRPDTPRETEGAVLAAWVEEVQRRDPDREVIHLAWAGRRILIYDVVEQRLYVRGVPPGPPGIIATFDLRPDELQSVRVDDTSERPA